MVETKEEKRLRPLYEMVYLCQGQNLRWRNRKVEPLSKNDLEIRLYARPNPKPEENRLMIQYFAEKGHYHEIRLTIHVDELVEYFLPSQDEYLAPGQGAVIEFPFPEATVNTGSHTLRIVPEVPNIDVYRWGGIIAVSKMRPSDQWDMP